MARSKLALLTTIAAGIRRPGALPAIHMRTGMCAPEFASRPRHQPHSAA